MEFSEVNVTTVSGSNISLKVLPESVVSKSILKQGNLLVEVTLHSSYTEKDTLKVYFALKGKIHPEKSLPFNRTFL